MQERFKLSKLLPSLPDGVIDAVCDLVPEPEDAELIRKGAVRGIEELEEGSRTAVQYISTRDIDRDSEILDPKGAILDQFKLAPQVLWGHDYSKPPIGSDKWVRVSDDGRGLIAKTQYATTERAEEVFKLKQEGHLKTQSVGFVPIESVERDGPGWGETIKKLGKRWAETADYFADAARIYTKWLLLEHSDVSVPSNIHALQLAVAKGLDVSAEMLTDLGVDVRAEKYNCECIECGHKLTSEKHCKDLKCPECGGQMRRAERPGPGQAALGIEPVVNVEETPNPERRIFRPKLRIALRQESPEVRDRRIWQEFVARQRGQV